MEKQDWEFAIQREMNRVSQDPDSDDRLIYRFYGNNIIFEGNNFAVTTCYSSSTMILRVLQRTQASDWTKVREIIEVFEEDFDNINKRGIVEAAKAIAAEPGIKKLIKEPESFELYKIFRKHDKKSPFDYLTIAVLEELHKEKKND